MKCDNTHTPSILTLALALEWLKEANLEEREKQDLRSAVETACRWFGTTPDKVPANIAILRKLFSGVPAGAVGVSKKRRAHMFRHASATYIVDVAPEQARMVVGVLGHAGFRTAKRHYVKGQQHMAVRKYQEAVSELTSRGKRRRRRTTKKQGQSP